MTLALLALALGGFAIGTTEFMTMGLLEEIADGIDRVHPDDGPHHHGVRVRRRRGRAGHRVARRAAAQAGARDRPDPGARRRQRDHGGRSGYLAGHGGAVRRRPAARRLLRRRVAARRVARTSGVPGPGGQLGHARAVGGDRRRCAGQHPARPAPRLAQRLLGRPGDRDRGGGDDLRRSCPHSPANTRRVAARRAVGAQAAAGAVRGGGRAWSASAACSRCTATSRRSSPRSRTCRGAGSRSFLLAFGIGSVARVVGAPACWPTGTSSGRCSRGFVATVVVLVGVLLRRAARRAGARAGLRVGALGSIVAINLQIRLMHAAGDAQMLGAALNHSALNIANGLGACFGSVVIAAGHGYRATSLVGRRPGGRRAC